MLITLLQGGGYRVLLQNSDISLIAQEVISQSKTDPVTCDVAKMNGYQVTGTGQKGDDWRAVGVQPQ